ncbi:MULTISPECIES: hypothetical protein [unclassified Nonomuraea]|uniref:hypothetical protein n=1 Tax=unclassified Nonomuraea TaxID=2593643 RepID=UPI0033E87108
MSPLKTRFASLAAVAALVVTAGCAEVNSTIDKTQACLEAPKIVADLGTQIGKLKDDPQAMDKALDDASKKLNDVADKAANTTLKEATDDLARTLGGIDVKNVNDAVDAVQKVGIDTAAYLEKVAKACS